MNTPKFVRFLLLAFGLLIPFGVSIDAQAQSQCGTWVLEMVNSDSRLEVVSLVTSPSQNCANTFKINNKTSALGGIINGYTMKLKALPFSTQLAWFLGTGNETFLIPSVDMELTVTPANPSQSAYVTIGSAETLDSFLFDLAFWAVSAIVPEGKCFVPKKTIALIAARTYGKLRNTGSLLIQGNLIGAEQEWANTRESFYTEALQAATEMGIEVAPDCLKDALKEGTKKTVGRVLILADLLTITGPSWIDNIRFFGQEVVFTLRYTPPSQTSSSSQQPGFGTIPRINPSERPTLHNPGNGFSLPTNTQVTLYWDALPNATAYQVEFWGTSYPRTVPCNWVTITSCQIGEMLPGRVFWRVKARTATSQESLWSENWSFRIGDSFTQQPSATQKSSSSAISAPSLVNPGHNTTWPQPTEIILSWQSVSGASQYKVELWGGPYSLMMPCDWVTTTSCRIGQMWPGTMYWRVKATNSFGQESNWSETWSFVIQESTKTNTSSSPSKSSCIKNKIAFSSNRDGNYEIYVMDEDGTNQYQLTKSPGNNTRPSWSSDGCFLAFVSDRDGNDEIYRINADGSNSRNLTNNSAADRFPTWSPDGTSILVESKRSGKWAIYIMNADGTNQRLLTNSPVGYPSDPQSLSVGSGDGLSWSPDGRYIAVGTSGGLYVMNSDASNPQKVYPYWARYPIWSLDGKSIYFAEWGSLQIVDPEGADLGRIALYIPGSDIPDIRPALSADGKRIFLDRFEDISTIARDIFVFDAAQRSPGLDDQINLTNNPADDYDPAWCCYK